MIKTVVKVNITVNNKEIELTHDEMKQLYYQIKPYIIEPITPTNINKKEWDFVNGIILQMYFVWGVEID